MKSNQKLSEQIFNYPLKPYTNGYGLPNLRGCHEDERPWDLSKVILSYSGNTKKLLDIGCGTSSKTIPLSKSFNEVIGIDISHEMIAKSQENIDKAGVSNMNVIYGDGENIPFRDNEFDVVTAILSRWNMAEIYRVLKPGGVLIIEHTDNKDKLNFKEEFAPDEYGMRAQLQDFEGDEVLNYFQKRTSEFFGKVQIKEGSWKTYYDLEGLLNLFKYTPTIRDFDPVKDVHIVDVIAKKYMTARGIETSQHRILVEAFK